MNNWDLGVNDFQAKDGKSQVGWLVDLVESISLEQLCAAGGYPRIQPEIFGHLRPVLWFLLLFTWGCRRCSSKFPSCCFKFCMDQNRIFHCVPRKLDGLPLSRAQIIQICGHRKFKVSGISGDELPEKLNTSSRRKSKFAILLIGSHSCFWNLLTSLFPFPKTCLKHIETLKTPTNYCMPPWERTQTRSSPTAKWHEDSARWDSSCWAASSMPPRAMQTGAAVLWTGLIPDECSTTWDSQ